MRSLRYWLGGVLLFVAVATEADQTVKVHDLAYGEALFHFFKQDYLMSGVRLLVAREQGKLGENEQDAELLLGGLQLSYGMHDAASETLQRVLSDKVARPTQNSAWYYLARSAYRRGYLDRADQALARITPDQTAEDAAQTTLLKALLSLAENKPESAVDVLATSPRGSSLDSYLDYNLGIAQLKTAERDRGMALLDRLGKEKTESPENLAIRDRANLAAAFSLLQSGEASQAQTFFQRVRLQEGDAGMALLGSGWAAAESNDYELALRMWGELVLREPRDNAVLEALFAVPFAYVQLKDPARAAHHYEQAIAIYLQERERLAQSTTMVKEGAFFDPLLRRGEGRALPVVPSLQQLHIPELVASHEFQEAWKSYRDLDQLQRNLLGWESSLKAFDTMLVTRKARFDVVVPAIEKRLTEIDSSSLRDRESALQARLESLRADQDVWELATPDQRTLRDEIQLLEQKIAQIPDPEERRVLAERVTRIKGVLYWQVHAVYPVRLWEMTKQVHAVEKERSAMDARLKTLRGARQFAAVRLGDLGGRVQRNRQRVSALLPRVARTLERQKAHLAQITLQALNERRAYLESYLLQSRYALAQLYDKAQSEAHKP